MKRLLLIFQLPILVRLLQRAALYRIHADSVSIFKYQTDQFNVIWHDAYTNVPFYAQWKKENNLPDHIADLKELNSWPVLTKKDFQLHKSQLYRVNEKPDGRFLTGGSTGEPMSLPTWLEKDTMVSGAIGHAGLGYFKGDRTFHMWGHRHLYGKGVRRRFLVCKQMIKDFMLNRYRFSSYDLSVDNLNRAYQAFTRFKPEVFSGFSAAVLAFCRVNKQLGNENKLKIRLVLCTAGPLSDQEKKEISEYFSAPVCMEYGSADCCLMAYTDITGKKYRVFWETHLLQGNRDENGEIENIVTRLTRCYIPFIRYRIGDYLELDAQQSLDSILELKSVKGRPSDAVSLPNGISFFGAIIGDCVKQIPSVISSQLHVKGCHLLIWVMATTSISEREKAIVVSRLTDVVSGIQKDDVTVVQVDELTRTIAGKIPLVVRD